MFGRALLLLLAVPGWLLIAQQPETPRALVAPHLRAAPRIDGLLDDLAWAGVAWSEPFVDIEGPRRPTPRHLTRVKVAWDSGYLYIAARMDEPDLWATLTTHDAVIYRDHDFEWFIDPDGDAARYFEFEINALGTGWDLFLDRPYRHGGRADNGWDIDGLRRAVHLDGTLNDPTDRDAGWTVEMAIPWAAFADGGRTAIPPAPGDSWRINFSRVQWDLDVVDGAYVKRRGADGKPLPEHNWVWSAQGEINMHIPERWGTVTFTSEKREARSEKREARRERREERGERRESSTDHHGPGDAMTEQQSIDRRGALAAMAAGTLALARPRWAAASGAFSAWTWVHGGAKDVDLAGWRSRYARLREAGITGVLVSGGDAAMHGEAAHAEGLVLHRWIWTMNRSGDATVKAEHPEWFSVSREGKSSLTDPPYVGYYQWLCPTRRPVREYLAGVVDGVAATPGVDAVHLDYIRHPDVILPRNLWETYGLVQDHEMAPYDFCYCEACRERFERETGRDPVALADPAADVAWRAFRWRMITETVEALARATHARGKAISAAVFPTPMIARRLVRQAWDRWPLDVVFPMTYHGFYREPVSWIETAVGEGVTALPTATPLVAGLYLPDLPPAALGEAMCAARRGGATGVSTFEMGGLSDAHLAVVKAVLAEG